MMLPPVTIPRSEIVLVVMRILEAEPDTSMDEAMEIARALILKFGPPS